MAPIAFLIVYIALNGCFMIWARRQPLSVQCGLLVFLALVPLGSFGAAFFLAHRTVHEGVAAAYWLPTFLVALPGLAVACMVLVGAFHQKPRTLRPLGAVVLSGLLAVAPIALMSRL
jgi:hypothetical protein